MATTPPVSAQDSFFNSASSYLSQQGDSIGQLIDYFTGEDKSKFVYREKNSDDCWYPPSCQALSTITPILVTSAIEYTGAKAKADAAEVVSSIFFEYSNQDLPQIYQAMNGSGGYNSVTAQMLANDAFAKANQKAAKEVLDNIQRYGNVRQGDTQALAQLYSATKGSYQIGSLGGQSGGSSGGSFGIIGDIIGGLF
jgi:hypothetical protein